MDQPRFRKNDRWRMNMRVISSALVDLGWSSWGITTVISVSQRFSTSFTVERVRAFCSILLHALLVSVVECSRISPCISTSPLCEDVWKVFAERLLRDLISANCPRVGIDKRGSTLTPITREQISANSQSVQQETMCAFTVTWFDIPCVVAKID